MNSRVIIAADVAAVLRQAEFEGPFVRLKGQVDRKLYEATDKVLMALGGKWNKKARAHIFASDAEPLIRDACGRGHAIDVKKTFEQFDTPPSLAARMLLLAAPKPSDLILEPSAGIGNLIRDRACRCRGITAIEIDEGRCAVLRELPCVDVWAGDFLEFARLSNQRADLRFDVVLMNPPFSNNQDIRHVTAAWQLLRPQGRFVALISPHSSFAGDAESVAFREWIKTIGALVEDIPAGTFSESGTQIRCQLLFARKLQEAPPEPAKAVGELL